MTSNPFPSHRLPQEGPLHLLQQQQHSPVWIKVTTGVVALLALLISVLAMLAAGGLLSRRFGAGRRILFSGSV